MEVNEQLVRAVNTGSRCTAYGIRCTASECEQYTGTGRNRKFCRKNKNASETFL